MEDIEGSLFGISILKSLIWIFKTEKNRFIEHAENLVDCTNKGDLQIKNSLILIESFRSLLKKLSVKQLLILKTRFNNLK